MIELEELGETLKEKFEDIASRMRFLDGLKDALQIKARAEKHFGMQLEQAAARIFGLLDHSPPMAKEVLRLITNDMLYSSVAHRRNSDKTLDSVVCNLDRFLEGVNLKRLKKRTKRLIKNRRKFEKQTKLESEDLRNHFVSLESIGDGYQKTLIQALDKATTDAKQLSTHMWRISKTYNNTGPLLQQMRNELNDFASLSIDFETEPTMRYAGLPPKRMLANLSLQSYATTQESVVIEQEIYEKEESAFEASKGTVSVASTNATVAAAAASAATSSHSGTDSGDDGTAAAGIASIAIANTDDITLNEGDCTHVEETHGLKNDYAIDNLTVQCDIASDSSFYDQVEDDKFANEATNKCKFDDYDELSTNEGGAESGCEEYFDTTSAIDESGCDWETASSLEQPRPDDQTLSDTEASGDGREEALTHNQTASDSETPENDVRESCSFIGDLIAEDVD